TGLKAMPLSSKERSRTSTGSIFFGPAGLEGTRALEMSEPLVIIGNGMAAARLCEELSKHALGRYAVAVIGEEPRLAYNRVLLSSVLAGETTSDDIALRPVRWWRDR